MYTIDNKARDKTMLIERSKAMTDYNKMFSDLASLKMMEKELKAEIEAKENEIKELMDRTCVAELVGAEHKATYKEVVSNRFDSKAFKADGYEDLYKAYQKPSTSMRFTFA